jgi:hypothetical protein
MDGSIHIRPSEPPVLQMHASLGGTRAPVMKSANHSLS